MRTPYDFASLSRSSIGFERLFDLINASAEGQEPEGRSPPYDITRTGEDSYPCDSRFLTERCLHHGAPEPFDGCSKQNPTRGPSNTSIAAFHLRTSNGSSTWLTTWR